MTSSDKVEELKDQLKKAAINGDYEILKACVASKMPTKYYLTVFPGISGEYYGNILHLAARLNREEFIREAINSLPVEVIQQLLLQVDAEETLRNPLHTAAAMGNVKIIKMFLSVYRAPSSSTLPQPSSIPAQPLLFPWLCRDRNGFTPCAAAIRFGYEDCGLEMLKMDLEHLSNITTEQGVSLLYSAVSCGCKKVALEILNSSPSFSYEGPEGYNALHFVTNLTEGEEICRLLLERDPTIIQKKSFNGCSVISVWAKAGKLWPFECLLKCDDIVPNIRTILVNLLSTTEKHDGSNSLHRLARISGINEKDAVDFAELLIDTYKKEAATQSSNSMSSSLKTKRRKRLEGSNTSSELFPWLAEDKFGWTPLTIAIHYGNEKFATYILSIDNNAVNDHKNNALFLAIDKKCHAVVNMILDIVDKQGWTQLLTDHNQGINVLHLAPKCKRDLFERLLKRHPELLEERSNMNTGSTILHKWVWLGEVWPIKYILHSGEIHFQWGSYFANNLIPALDYSGNNPFHVNATTTHEAKGEIAKLLVEAFRERTLTRRLKELPWFTTNQDRDGPLHLAILNQSENLALYILSLHDGHLSQVLDLYNPVHKTIFLAIEKNCYQVAKVIFERLNTKTWSTYLMDSSNGRSVLHLAPTCEDKEFGIWLVNKAPEFITKSDKSGNTPLDEASNVGAEWIIKAMLEKCPSAFIQAPLAWIKACENGHVLALQAFVDNNPTHFRNRCLEHKDSPLHHVKLTNLIRYKELFDIPCMKDLINVQDSQGQTPLHKAIRTGNILLTETLLKVEGIEYNIKDNENQTVIDLLGQVCLKHHEWDHMCKNLGFDPKIKMTYFQHKTNLLDARNTLCCSSITSHHYIHCWIYSSRWI